MLYHLLPVVFWLLAAGGIVLWVLLSPPASYVAAFLPAVLALISVLIIHHIPRHGDAVEPSLQMALILGVAAYWLPTVVFLLLPLWGYMVYRNLFNLRVFFASLIGLAVVAIWMAVISHLSTFHFPLQIGHNLSAWIPTGAVLSAWLASTIARQTLRVR